MDLQAAALLEDYFFVNPTIKGFPESAAERDLVDPFCASADGYMKIKLNINYASTSGIN